MHQEQPRIDFDFYAILALKEGHYVVVVLNGTSLCSKDSSREKRFWCEGWMFLYLTGSFYVHHMTGTDGFTKPSPRPHLI